VCRREVLSLQLSYQRAAHKFVAPVVLLRQPSIMQCVLAVLGAAFFTLFVKIVILQPAKRRKKKKKLEKLKRDSAAQTEISKRHAESATKLMMPTVARKISYEESRRGLIVVYAKYGNLERDAKEEKEGKKSDSPSAIDVTVPLQNLVEDSKLILHVGSKSILLGFYDPCVGEDKQLYIRYLFKDKLHEVTIDDAEAIGLPLECKFFMSSI